MTRRERNLLINLAIGVCLGGALGALIGDTYFGVPWRGAAVGMALALVLEFVWRIVRKLG